MIKFFRKIRYDLMEKNKTGKYLKYAIGEIVLVVIGILIALQINNYDIQKQDEKIEQIYLLALQNEFKNNIEISQYFLNIFSSQIPNNYISVNIFVVQKAPIPTIPAQ